MDVAALVISIVAILIAAAVGIAQIKGYRVRRPRLVLEVKVIERTGRGEFRITNVGGTEETVKRVGVRVPRWRWSLPLRANFLRKEWSWRVEDGDAGRKVALNDTVFVDTPIELAARQWPNGVGRNAVAFAETLSGRTFQSSLSEDGLMGPWGRAHQRARKQMGL